LKGKVGRGQEYKQNTWGMRINIQIIRKRMIKYNTILKNQRNRRQ
jgi:hypothetical protein